MISQRALRTLRSRSWWSEIGDVDDMVDAVIVSAARTAVGKAPKGTRFRLGGMVEKGSVQRVPGSIEVKFLVTDFKHTVPVTYSGVLPDLFKDGQGVVGNGRLQNGVFVADEILAKHDEKYMPPEVAKALKDNPPPPSAIPSS